MATILGLRSTLATLLASNLGTYTLANGATTPAISVRDLGERLSPGTTVSGVECVIVSEPELDPVRSYRQGKAQSVWTVYLVDWSGSTTKRLQEVAGKIVDRWPGSKAVTITPPPVGAPRSQMRVDVKTTSE